MLKQVEQSFEQLQNLGYSVVFKGEQQGVQLYSAHVNNRAPIDFFMQVENDEAVFGFSYHAINTIKPIHLERLNVFRKVSILKFARGIERLGVDIQGFKTATSTSYYAELTPFESVRFKRDNVDKFTYLQTTYLANNHRDSFVLCNYNEFVEELKYNFRFN